MPLYSLAIIFTAELIALYFLSKKISKSMYVFFYILTRNRTVSITLLSFILLPGTVIHEFAHLLVAEILRVPTGKLSFTPQFDPQPHGKTEVAAATVQIGKSDPIRRYLIGFAPVFVGLAALATLSYLSLQYIPGIIDLKMRIIITLLATYLAFTFSNTMFSSKQDLKGFLAFAPVLLIITVGLYYLGIRVSLTTEMHQILQNTFSRLTMILGTVLVINAISLAFTQGLLRVWERLTHKKLTF